MDHLRNCGLLRAVECPKAGIDCTGQHASADRRSVPRPLPCSHKAICRNVEADTLHGSNIGLLWALMAQAVPEERLLKHLQEGLCDTLYLRQSRALPFLPSHHCRFWLRLLLPRHHLLTLLPHLEGGWLIGGGLFFW